ncbi:MAG: dipicolinate synthase [Oscillospiraceae bacterium]|nr:dipicolinate synthase [Oscillospiraceae bacterium]
MKKPLHVWVVGGDQRQVKLAQLLRADGHQVSMYGLENAPDLPWACETELDGAARADCTVLPVPVRGEGELLNAPHSSRQYELPRLLDALGGVVCAGGVDEELRALAGSRGLTLYDYLDREELAVANAVPTVEGALQIAMEQLSVTLHGSRTLVVGYGRLGRLLAHRLAALGADVTVSARNWGDLAWIEAFGYSGLFTGELDGWLEGYDLLVNTVPAPVLGKERLGQLSPGCLVIDLASRPGGVDRDAAGELGVKVIWALSLPGRTAPVTAARAIRDAVYHILQEQGV